MDTSSASGKMLAVQYLRAISALLVVINHASAPQNWLFDPFRGNEIGLIGVHIFFVISGVIMFTTGRNMTTGEFFRRRLIRIVPLYWLATFAMLACILVYTPADLQANTYLNLLKSLLFVPFYNSLHGGQVWPFLVVGWTLNFEAFFYLLFGLSLLLPRMGMIALSGTILGLICVGALVPGSGALYETYTDAIMLDFVIGLAIAFAFSRMDLGGAIWLMPLGLAGLYLGAKTDNVLIYTPSAGIIVAAAIAADQRGLTPLSRFLERVGDASYSIYLVHLMVIFVLNEYLWRLPWHGWRQYCAYMSVMIAFSTIAGLCVHFLVEKPLTRWLGAITRPAASLQRA